MKKVLLTVVAGMALLVGMAAPATAATTGAQNFSFIYVGEGDTATVAANGPISGVGKSVTVSDDGEGHGVDEVTFKKGTFVLDHDDIDSSFQQTFNERTCVGRFSASGDYTLGSGTGVYAGVSGSGTYSYRGTFFGHRTADGCSDDGTYLVSVRARGTTTL
ncbi:MAG: hypothetical protein QOE93_1815 [Actinomycetota bacterium]|nr:hypothetical protein [Actinomycetota bacterium]